MKKAIWAIAVICFVILLSTSSASAKNESFGLDKNPSSPTEKTGFILPASLVSIGEDAFEGTAATYVYMPDNVVTVGDRAFARMHNLLILRLSRTIKEMGDAAFEDDSGITLSGAINHNSELWAKKYNVPFIPEAGLIVPDTENGYCIIQKHDPYIRYKYVTCKYRGEKTETKEAHRPGRTEGELKASHYKGIAAQYIQSRFFP